MADYYAILKKAIDARATAGAAPDRAERQAIYDKAEAALTRQLARMDPPPPPERVEGVRRRLQEAAATLEAEHADALINGAAARLRQRDEAPAEMAVDAPRETPQETIPEPHREPAAALPEDDGAADEAATGDETPGSDDATTEDAAEPQPDAVPRDEVSLETQTPLEEQAPKDDASPSEPALTGPLLGLDTADPAAAMAADPATAVAAPGPDDLDEGGSGQTTTSVQTVSAHGSAVSGFPSAPGLSSLDAAPEPLPASQGSDDADTAPDFIGTLDDEAEREESGWTRHFDSTPAAETGPEDATVEPGARPKRAVPAGLARRGSRRAGPIAVTALVLALGAAGVAYWQRDTLTALLVPETGEPVEEVSAPPAPEPAEKIAERITETGIEVVDAANTPEATPTTAPTTAPLAAPRDVNAEPATAAPEAPLVADASAALYEERADGSGEGDRYDGGVSWTAETEPTTEGEDEMVLRGVVRVPDRGLDILVTLRRNTDETLPASHTIEVLIEPGPGFAPGGIQNVMGVLARPATGAQADQFGVPLNGASARITDGYYLIGLSAVAEDEARNVELLQSSPRFEIPILYSNGQRAILELNKGSEGTAAFGEAFEAWAG